MLNFKKIGLDFENLVNQELNNLRNEGLILDYLKLAPESFYKYKEINYAKMYNGFSDFLIFMPYEKVIFLEVKAFKNTKESKNQVNKRLKYQKAGYFWYVLKEDITEIRKIIKY